MIPRFLPLAAMTRPLLLLILSLPAVAAEAPLPDKPQYNRDIRPILADACFRCHGFDKNKRKADRRLDTRDGALAEKDGIRAIVPGKADESEMVKRFLTTQEDDMMPPLKETRHLSPREKDILKRWIEQGAEYQDHWAYIPPVKPAVPEAGAQSSVRGAQSDPPGTEHRELSTNPIDSFIAAR